MGTLPPNICCRGSHSCLGRGTVVKQDITSQSAIECLARSGICGRLNFEGASLPFARWCLGRYLYLVATMEDLRGAVESGSELA